MSEILTTKEIRTYPYTYKMPYDKKWVSVEYILKTLKEYRERNYEGLSAIAHSDILRLEEKLQGGRDE